MFFTGEFHGQRSLAGYSSWGCKESDMTEQLILSESQVKIRRNKNNENRLVRASFIWITKDYWPIKVSIVKAMVFPVVVYGCGSWTIMKAECRSIDVFKLWCWRRL